MDRLFCDYKQAMGTDDLIVDHPKLYDGFSDALRLDSAAPDRDVDDWTRVGDWAEIAAYFAGET